MFECIIPIPGSWNFGQGVRGILHAVSAAGPAEDKISAYQIPHLLGATNRIG